MLPKELKPSIPFAKEHESLSKRVVSDGFSSLLQGLMEVRPTYRLGGRNIHALRAQPFFTDNNLSNWDYLCTKTYAPRLSGVPYHTKPNEEGTSDVVNVMCDLDGRIMDAMSEKRCVSSSFISNLTYSFALLVAT